MKQGNNVFGTNEIVGKAYFKDEPEGTLVVTSIFYTFQGEGPYSGLPAVFVRLSKCNLACSFCDTQFDQGERLTFDQIESRIYDAVCSFWNNQGKTVPLWALKRNTGFLGRGDREIGPYGCGLVVTGGEPTLQKNLKDFLSQVHGQFDWAQIESNGIITQDIDKDVTVVVSPKCVEKNGAPTQYLKPSAEMLERADCLKFVMCAGPDRSDLNVFIDHIDSPYESVPNWALEWRASTGRPVYVSPMNVYKDVPKRMRMLIGKTDKTLQERSTADEVVSFWEPGVLDMEANRRNHEHAARYAIEHGLRFQVQTHLYAGMA